MKSKTKFSKTANGLRYKQPTKNKALEIISAMYLGPCQRSLMVNSYENS